MDSGRTERTPGRADDAAPGLVWRAHPLADDSSRLGAHLMAALALLVGVHLALTGASTAGLCAAALLAVGAAVSAVLPWSALPPWAGALPSCWALGALALVAADTYAPYPAAAFTLVFLHAGLVLGGRTVAALGVGALALTGVAAVTSGHTGRLPGIALAIGTGLLVAAVVSRLVERHRGLGHELRALLTAVTALGESPDTDSAAQVVVDLAVELLRADGAQLLLTEVPGGTQLELAATSCPGGRTVADGGVPDSGAQLALALRRPVFVPDAPAHPLLSAELADMPATRSVLLAPLPGEGGHLGVLQVWWRRPHHLDGLAEQAVELLTRHSGQVLDRLRSMQRLEAQASTDALTGLANRREFLLALGGLRPGGTVVFLDLDHFKALNDGFGHAAGDEVLARFGAVLQGAVRDGDCAARYGGEEFALVLPRGGVEGARIVVNRVRQRWAAEATGVTFSTGVCAHHPGTPAATTLAAADAALYEAKRTGRDRVVEAPAPPDLSEPSASGDVPDDTAPPRLRSLPLPRPAAEDVPGLAATPGTRPC